MDQPIEDVGLHSIHADVHKRRRYKDENKDRVTDSGEGEKRSLQFSVTVLMNKDVVDQRLQCELQCLKNR